jgi:hypothetical protein
MNKRISRESREAFGRECDKFNGHNDLRMAGEFPERFTTLAKRSEEIAQALAPPNSSAVFRSDSRGEEFFC